MPNLHLNARLKAASDSSPLGAAVRIAMYRAASASAGRRVPVRVAAPDAIVVELCEWHLPCAVAFGVRVCA
jgi:hypothetical protein